MDENNNIPAESHDDDVVNIPESPVTPPPEDMPLPPANIHSAGGQQASDNGGEDDPSMENRLERLGGEPAPVITPEEFARLQKAGQVHIDAQGRVKATRRTGAEAGVSLNKRRAWY